MRKIAIFYAAAVSVLAAVEPAGAQELVITNARVLDGTGGIIERGSVVVRDGRIDSVTDGAVPSEGMQRIDAQGRTVMPGFIDAHRHLVDGDPSEWLENAAPERMREFIGAGFTSVLSAIDPTEQILELRRRLEAGEVAGPRLVAAGFVPLAESIMPGGDVDPARVDPSREPFESRETAGAIPEEATRRAVERLAEAGVDAIKTVIITTPDGPEQETLELIVEEAERHGLPTITHAVTVRDTLAAVEAGTTRLVHTPHIGELDTETAQRIASADIPMTSTLGVFTPYFDDDNEPLFRDRGPFPWETLSSAGQGPVNARLLWEQGMTYAYGTDTSWPPRDSLAHELDPLRLVFSAEDIVTILTSGAAEAIGRADEVGTLESGKLADIVMVDGNPLEDIGAVLDVRLVVKGGIVYVDRR